MTDLLERTRQYMHSRGYTDEQLERRWGIKKSNIATATYLAKMRTVVLHPNAEYSMDWSEDHAKEVEARLGKADAGRAASMASGVIRLASRSSRK